ncbi:ADP-ribosylglycohydrolase family protein [Paenibacillus sediminis]|uniref:ADP-ribosylglycohydrolase n=1 Tax=Paenibacillus sediminis TaxID=664909 RepID=A0ABS4GZ11_9BACL|nr:ADP-ribosylglycohydrolase family protein [Paenibacillus sediminis]MBP1935272.1 ADP-ribosylglycohydrolase [Paenibacillus sediminis]
MAGYAALDVLLNLELTQLDEEGYDTAGLHQKLQAAGTDGASLLEVYEEMQRLPKRQDFSYIEPSDLEHIRLDRPAGPRKLDDTLHDSQWKDKFYGAWLGRCCGCALGKPLESYPFNVGKDGKPGWFWIKAWYEGADAWPIQGYVPRHSRLELTNPIEMPNIHSYRDMMTYMESDDDLRYTVLGLVLLEQKGLQWDSWDIGDLWHKYLTYQQVCTAETQSYINFIQVAPRENYKKPSNWPERKEWVRTYLNPYREWIGAQIRADAFGYAAAGNPELAAELAWRDGSFSHVKNGIYGEMYTAAMIAAAFVTDDVEDIVRIGLSEIPQQSRLAQAIHQAIEITKTCHDQIELVGRIEQAFNSYNWVHTINNAALVTAALLFSEGDFETAITTAVLGGWDTDCNGATLGSIMGAMLGASRLPSRWTEPLDDTLYAEIINFHPISISECAQRSYSVFRKIQSELNRSK